METTVSLVFFSPFISALVRPFKQYYQTYSPSSGASASSSSLHIYIVQQEEKNHPTKTVIVFLLAYFLQRFLTTSSPDRPVLEQDSGNIKRKLPSTPSQHVVLSPLVYSLIGSDTSPESDLQSENLGRVQVELLHSDQDPDRKNSNL